MSILDYEFCLATIEPPRIWNFYPTLDAAQEAQPEINGRNTEQYQPMAYSDYKAAERASYLSNPAVQITAERFMEMLEVLPPNRWTNDGQFESFLMCEHFSGPYTEQYARRGSTRENSTYWVKMVDAGDRSTWMTWESLKGVTA